MTKIKTEKLSHFAAQRLVPEDIEEGERQVTAFAKKLYWRFFVIYVTCNILSGLALVALGIELWWLWLQPHNYKAFAPFVWEMIFSTLCAVFWFGPGIFQRRKRFFANRPYDTILPLPIEELLAELASGQIKAIMPAKSGAVSISALQNTEGMLFDTILNPDDFKNRYAPALLSSNEKYYSGAKIPKISPTRPIYVVTIPAKEANSNDEAVAHDEPKTQTITVATANLSEPILEKIGLENLDAVGNASEYTADEKENVIRHWRSLVPPEQRTAFCETFAIEGGWKGEDAKKVIIALQAVFSYDGKVKPRVGRETLPPLIGAAVAALRRAVEDGQIETLWLSDAHRPDPSSSLEKMLGDAKDHKYTKIRIKTFKILGICGS